MEAPAIGVRDTGPATPIKKPKKKEDWRRHRVMPTDPALAELIALIRGDIELRGMRKCDVARARSTPYKTVLRYADYRDHQSIEPK